jgi:uncharacterized protein (DUF362 family)/Pyruvate/2-oxoacid:ferredoxin oxidoreductase delta subunit
MGGIEQFLSPEENLALKVNLLVATPPEKAATTHPSLAAGMGKILREQGANPFVIDSPTAAYHFDQKTLERLYRKTGLAQAAHEADMELNYDTRAVNISYPEGQFFQQFDLLTPLVQADGVFNLCKLKTHSFMGMTGAVKNLFGAIPGRAKVGFHGKLPNPDLFAQMLLDLSACVGPRLSVMDAVVGMEGNGPNNGSPRQIGLLLAAENPLALDIVVSAMIGLREENNPLLQEAQKRGLSPSTLEDVELIGMDRAELPLPNFALPDTFQRRGSGSGGLTWFQETFSPFIKDAFSLKPDIQQDICIACGDCKEICPMDAITIHRQEKCYARIHYDDCIRCYCCHETCPQDAIDLKKTTLYQFLELLNV